METFVKFQKIFLPANIMNNNDIKVTQTPIEINDNFHFSQNSNGQNLHICGK